MRDLLATRERKLVLESPSMTISQQHFRWDTVSHQYLIVLYTNVIVLRPIQNQVENHIQMNSAKYLDTAVQEVILSLLLWYHFTTDYGGDIDYSKTNII